MIRVAQHCLADDLVLPGGLLRVFVGEVLVALVDADGDGEAEALRFVMSSAHQVRNVGLRPPATATGEAGKNKQTDRRRFRDGDGVCGSWCGYVARCPACQC